MPADSKISFKTKDGREVSFARKNEKSKPKTASKKVHVMKQINKYLAKSKDKLFLHQIKHLEKSLLSNPDMQFEDAVVAAKQAKTVKRKPSEVREAEVVSNTVEATDV
jgi:hypothetical protein